MNYLFIYLFFWLSRYLLNHVFSSLAFSLFILFLSRFYVVYFFFLKVMNKTNFFIVWNIQMHVIFSLKDLFLFSNFLLCFQNSFTKRARVSNQRYHSNNEMMTEGKKVTDEWLADSSWLSIFYSAPLSTVWGREGNREKGEKEKVTGWEWETERKKGWEEWDEAREGLRKEEYTHFD